MKQENNGGGVVVTFILILLIIAVFAGLIYVSYRIVNSDTTPENVATNEVLEENVENPKKNNKLIVIALLVWLVVSFIIFLRGDLLGIVSFGIAILAISIYGIIYMINI